MAGAQEKLDRVLRELREIAAARERLVAGAAVIEKATAQARAFVAEVDDLRATTRLNYRELTDAIKSETLRRSTFHTLLDRMSVGMLTAIAVLALQYLVASLMRFL